jgi:uncharacterized repeat protein (TIGR03803 family)
MMKKFTFLKFIPPAITCFIIALSTAVLAQNPAFIGMTQQGGTGHGGTIFAFDPSVNKDYVLWNFGNDSADGRAPYASLTYNFSNGLFYGMTNLGGGTKNAGTIFSFSPLTNLENVVWAFGQPGDGSGPQGSLAFGGSEGLIYGMTGQGGSYQNSGTIFQFDPSLNSEKVIWNLESAGDGRWPVGSLVYNSSSGIFYAMTSGGGSDIIGSIISFNPATSDDSLLWSFGVKLNDGRVPLGNLVLNPVTGVYYGLTYEGGTHNEGAIISFDPSIDSESMVWSFGGANDGINPAGDMVYNTVTGLFYGMTSAGGTNNAGTIFSFNPLTNQDSVLWSFGSYNDGRSPGNGALVYYGYNGLYYGTTTSGGSNNGVIFSFDPLTYEENVVWRFKSDSDGQGPVGSLALYPVGVPVGITTPGKNPSSVQLFPNPNNGQFRLSGLSAGQTIAIFNCLGQKVKEFAAEANIQQLSISNEADAIYIVAITGKDGSPAGQFKLVKTN